MPPAQRTAFLTSLSPDEATYLYYDWEGFWARPEQLEPPGDWRVWLLLAGRGFGKTRTGAEFVIKRVRAGAWKRVALVAETAADARDVMIEGESGILACSPPWFRPVYEPSKRRLTWPNGAYALTFSGKEPDQLRGPQHDGAWADEPCLIAGTLIATARGQVPIEQVRVGEYVWTRAGLRQVNHAGMTRTNAEVYALETTDGRTLTGTANHPVWVEGQGFIPLRLLSYGAILKIWDSKSQSSRVSCGAGTAGGSTVATIATVVADSCTALFTRLRMALSPLALKFTTRTAIRQTTNSPISRRSPALTIGASTPATDTRGGHPNGGAKRSLPNGRHANLTSRLARIAATLSAPLARALSIAQALAAPPITARHTASVRRAPVRTVDSPSLPTRRTSVSAQGLVVRLARMRAALTQPNVARAHALTAARLSALLTPAPSAAPASVVSATAPRVSSVRLLPDRSPVYNLEVDGCPEYFANGLLTHNCKWQYPEDAWDNLEFGLRLGPHPQVVASTTPRPIKLIRDLLADPQTVKSRGSTYANQDNLAPSFIKRVLRKYEGTRLGRQELHAELLDDAPGALWQRVEMLDKTRVRDHPQLVRVVVAIDPSVSSGEDAADAGIMAGGLGVDGHGYLLEDGTTHGSPHTWAMAALTLFNKYRGDRIVGEVNNGGEMVELTIRTLRDQNDKPIGLLVPYAAVHASRGKQARAEPISSLYEQGRVHHVGTFGLLEDELCNWVPGSGQPSPNRLDALVWLFTELMLGEPSETQHVTSYRR